MDRLELKLLGRQDFLFLNESQIATAEALRFSLSWLCFCYVLSLSKYWNLVPEWGCADAEGLMWVPLVHVSFRQTSELSLIWVDCARICNCFYSAHSSHGSESPLSSLLCCLHPDVLYCRTVGVCVELSIYCGMSCNESGVIRVLVCI